MNFECVAESKLIDHALIQNDWSSVMRILEGCPSLVNAVFPKTRTQRSLLHVAAEQDAPPRAVEQLLRFGACRTVSDVAGRKPYEIAKRNRFEGLARLLRPELVVDVDPDPLGLVQEMFHGLLRTLMRAYKTPVRLRLPQLSILTEKKDLRVWFPIPMMAGGCSFWLGNEENQWVLHAESWCQMCGGSGMHHRITPTEIVLVKEEHKNLVSVIPPTPTNGAAWSEAIANPTEPASLEARGGHAPSRPIGFFRS